MLSESEEFYEFKGILLPFPGTNNRKCKFDHINVAIYRKKTIFAANDKKILRLDFNCNYTHTKILRL